jgi:hypothetical protein
MGTAYSHGINPSAIRRSVDNVAKLHDGSHRRAIVRAVFVGGDRRGPHRRGTGGNGEKPGGAGEPISAPNKQKRPITQSKQASQNPLRPETKQNPYPHRNGHLEQRTTDQSSWSRPNNQSPIETTTKVVIRNWTRYFTRLTSETPLPCPRCSPFEVHHLMTESRKIPKNKKSSSYH